MKVSALGAFHKVQKVWLKSTWATQSPAQGAAETQGHLSETAGSSALTREDTVLPARTVGLFTQFSAWSEQRHVHVAAWWLSTWGRTGPAPNAGVGTRGRAQPPARLSSSPHSSCLSWGTHLFVIEPFGSTILMPEKYRKKETFHCKIMYPEEKSAQWGTSALAQRASCASPRCPQS